MLPFFVLAVILVFLYQAESVDAGWKYYNKKYYKRFVGMVKDVNLSSGIAFVGQAMCLDSKKNFYSYFSNIFENPSAFGDHLRKCALAAKAAVAMEPEVDAFGYNSLMCYIYTTYGFSRGEWTSVASKILGQPSEAATTEDYWQGQGPVVSIKKDKSLRGQEADYWKKFTCLQ